MEEDKETLRELISEFILSLEIDTLQLQLAFQNGDLVDLGNVAHKLKSVFRYLGVTHVEPFLRELESLCRAGDSDPQIKRMVEEVIRCGTEALTEVRQLMHQLFPT
jgi:HPt (histidine-containing phosphotransfer) domain-containing protein